MSTIEGLQRRRAPHDLGILFSGGRGGRPGRGVRRTAPPGLQADDAGVQQVAAL
jgi:hypothetical protein